MDILEEWRHYSGSLCEKRKEKKKTHADKVGDFLSRPSRKAGLFQCYASFLIINLPMYIVTLSCTGPVRHLNVRVERPTGLHTDGLSRLGWGTLGW